MAIDQSLHDRFVAAKAENKARREAIDEPDPLVKGGGGGDSGDMEARVGRLEQGLGRLEITLAAMNEKLSHLATSDELAKEIGTVKTALAGKPGTGAMWLMGIALLALVVGAIALGPIIIPALQGHS